MSGLSSSSADPANAPHGWVFLCDGEGSVIRDFLDPPGSPRGDYISAHSLVALVDPGAWIDFLESVRTRGAFFSREFTIDWDGSALRLFCGGCQSRAGVLVFAATTGSVTAPAAGGFATPMAKAIHDLNNPISSIISSCDYLSEYARENLTPEQLTMIGVIEMSARNLLILSGRIAELSRLSGLASSPDAF